MEGSSPQVQGIASLVTELDARLPRAAPKSPGRFDRKWLRRRTVPAAIAFSVVVALLVAAGSAALNRAADRCELGEAICAIEHLDIDAVLLTVPDADLFDLIPPIEQIDPDDSLTIGDVLRLDGIRELDPSTLLTPSEIERVRRQLD